MMREALKERAPEPGYDRGTGSDAWEPSDNPLNVVHVLAPASFGGLERVVIALAVGHAAQGHRVRIAPVVHGPGDEDPFVVAARAHGCEVTPIEVSTRDYRGERRLILELCQSFGAHVLHTHGYRPDFLDSGVAVRLGIPRVSTIHGFTGGDWKNRVYERLQLRTLRRFDAVVAVSRAQIDRLSEAKISRERIHVIPNAWFPGAMLDREAARAKLEVPESAFHIGWVGRISREKGPDVFIDALRQLGEAPAVVSILGDGPLRAELEADLDRDPIPIQIRWQGAVPDASQLFPAFDAFVVSSRTEGTPIVLLEAMAARVPILSTRVGGIPDMVSSEEAYFVPSDDPQLLAAGLRSMIRNPAERAKRANTAQVRLQAEFSFTRWVDRYEALYRQLVHTSSR